jgi:Icc-related predicted phosphoesterase
MRIVTISDTHNQLNQIKLPKGDLLIHAGDWCMRGDIVEVSQFAHDLKSVAYGFKYGAVVIAGNHDWLAQTNDSQVRGMLKDADIKYLKDEQVIINDLKIWGSPWSPWFFDWAFNLERGEEIRAKWDMIPLDTDILITHGPPEGILDRVPDGTSVGCEELRIAVERVKPKLSIHGHIHNDYGVYDHSWPDGKQTRFVNAAICTERYKPTNEPIVVEI